METVVNLTDFSSNGIPAICIAMISVVIWAVTAWYFGIPTSESHALMAALLGAGVAVNGSFSSFDKSEWIKVIYGLLLSLFLDVSFYSEFMWCSCEAIS